MNVRRLLLLLLGVFALSTLILFGSGERGGGSGSSLSPAGAGWLGARLYLEGRGLDVRLLDRPLEDYFAEADSTFEAKTFKNSPDPIEGTLVLAFPWNRTARDEELLALRRFLAGGGTVVLASSPRKVSPAEDAVLAEIGLDRHDLRPPPPLAPAAWWRHVRAVWQLEPGPDLPLPEITRPEMTAQNRGARAPSDARVLFTGGEHEEALVFEFAALGGRVVAVPAPLLSNASLSTAGNADLLETLARWLPQPWNFLEHPHGLVAEGLPTDPHHQRVFDLFWLQLGLIYALAVFALARRFGPAWQEPPVPRSSNAAFLLGLGALHHRLGHHQQAGALLVERAAQLDRRLRLPPDLVARARDASAGDLRALAEEVAKHQASPVSAPQTPST